MQPNDLVRLRHMLDAAKEAVGFTTARSRADLDRDRMLTLSLIKLIEIIGEAANGVSVEYQNQHPDIPWPDIIGMRHRLIHAYFDVNLDIVWATVAYDLPPLVITLEKILRQE
jgi:uncharacterized protein with HEPN domain